MLGIEGKIPSRNNAHYETSFITTNPQPKQKQYEHIRLSHMYHTEDHTDQDTEEHH